MNNKIFFLFIMIFFNIFITILSAFWSNLRVFVFIFQTIILPLYFFVLVKIVLIPKKYPSQLVYLVSPTDGLVTNILNNKGYIIDIVTYWFYFSYAKFCPVNGYVNFVEKTPKEITIILKITDVEFFIEGNSFGSVIKESKENYQVNNHIKIKFSNFQDSDIYIYKGQFLRKGDLMAVVWLQSLTSIDVVVNDKGLIILENQKVLGGESPIFI